MYLHWSEMEASLEEWGRAALAAEAGLECRSDSHRLRSAAGYARSRLGQELMRELQPRAIDELLRARDHYRSGLRSPEKIVGHRDRIVQARNYRGLVLTLDMIVRLIGDEDRKDIERRRAFAKEGLELLALWTREHPDDPRSGVEAARLEPRLRAALA